MTAPQNSAKGAGRSYKARVQSEHDNYETPAHCLESLLRREPLYGTVLEPSCGPGSLCREILRLCPWVDLYACDLRQGTGIYGIGGCDFTRAGFADDQVDFVVTNPPFKQTIPFVLQALRVARRAVYVFQRNDLDATEGRYEALWRHGYLGRKYTFVKRAQLYQEGRINLAKSGMMEFAWYVIYPVRRPGGGYWGNWIEDDPAFDHDTRVGFSEALERLPEDRKAAAAEERARKRSRGGATHKPRSKGAKKTQEAAA